MATISIGITFFLITLIMAVASYQQTTNSVSPVNAHSPSAPKPGRFNVLNSKRIILMEEFHPVDRKRTARQTPDDDEQGLDQADFNEENNDVIVLQPEGSGNEESNDEGIVPLVPGVSYDSENILPSSSTISPNDVFAEGESSDDADVEEDSPSPNTEIRSSNSVVGANGENVKEDTKTEEMGSSNSFSVDLPDWEDVTEAPVIVTQHSKTEDTDEEIRSSDSGLEDFFGFAGGLIEATEIVEDSETEDTDEEQHSAATVIPENDEDSQWESAFGGSVETNNAEGTDETTETTVEDEDREMPDRTKDGSETSSSEQVDEVETTDETSEPASDDGAVQHTDDPPASEDQDEGVNEEDVGLTTVSPNGREKSTTTWTVTPRSSPSGPQHLVLKFMRENVYIIVGFLLGVPAVVLLVYVLNVKRLRRHTGRLKVTPSHKKRPIEGCAKNDCSNTTLVTEENELAHSPTGKTPRPSSFNKSPYS